MKNWWDRWWWLAGLAYLVGGFAIFFLFVEDHLNLPVNGGGDLPPEPDLPVYVLSACGDDLCLGTTSWQILLEEEGWSAEWEPVDRRLVLRRDEDEARQVWGLPVLEVNGHFLPLSDPPRLDGDDNPQLPLSLVEALFGWELAVTTVAAGSDLLRGLDGANEETTPVDGGDGSVLVLAVTARPEPDWPVAGPVPTTVAELSAHLAFTQNPIEGATTDFPDGHLPRAERAYRLGIHQGFDWYEWGIGVPMTRNTPVRAAADGTVIRADRGWETPSRDTWDGWVLASTLAQRTPEWTLDRFRGRQVWVDHGEGVMVRYAHLTGIAAEVTVGARVSAGQVIAYVGNSGTSAEARGTDEGLHLHADILIYGENPWMSLSWQEMREVLAAIWAEEE